ncbi:MAG TPA: hypothetical protein VJ728_14190 [Candidatus Binataceae bacterium]|nr:hypothetical protein [Candidatus Binataceae bacterium]
MDEVSEYRRHKERCQELAAKADGPERKFLVDMAVEWERRATQAEAKLRGRPPPRFDTQKSDA